jgi:hypothetical protein
VQEAADHTGSDASTLLYRLAQEEAGEGPTAIDVAAMLVKDALARLKDEVRRGDDIALAHEINGLMDRIQLPDVDVGVVDAGLELLRSQEHGAGAAA